MINDVYFNFRKQKLTLVDLSIPPYQTIFVLSLNCLVSHFSFHFPFKTT
jgi:hypothetical protein